MPALPPGAIRVPDYVSAEELCSLSHPCQTTLCDKYIMCCHSFFFFNFNFKSGIYLKKIPWFIHTTKAIVFKKRFWGVAHCNAQVLSKYFKMNVWGLHSSKINVREKSNQFLLRNKIFCMHPFVREAACFLCRAGVGTNSAQHMYLCINDMTFATLWNVILERFNQRIKETTVPLQIDTGQFISRRYCNSGSIAKHSLCISLYGETQRRSVQARDQFTSNDREWTRSCTD